MGDDLDRDLHLPRDTAPRAAATVLHPHPAMGGDRHHPLVMAVAEGLAAAGVAALRLDLPDPDLDVSAALLTDAACALRSEINVDRLFIIGYSWGSIVSARAAVDAITARVLVAPPVAHIELPSQPEPTLVLVPAHDQYGPPDAAEAALASWPDARLEVVDGCDHFLAGAVRHIADRTVAWVAER